MNKIKYLVIILTVILISGCKKNSYKLIIKDDLVLFGSYPQTLETDKTKLKELEKYNSNNWNSDYCYINGNLESIIKYIDIDLNNDSKFDYRGISFGKYKPINTEYESIDLHSYQDDYGYNINQIYWFKYEPIKWNIIDKKEENKSINYKLISNTIIDSIEYYPSDEKLEFMHNGKIGYSNNYELSNIRKWLNNEFYNLAFSNEEKEVIIASLIINKSIDNSNIYECDNTLDKVSILSVMEAKSYNGDNSRRVSPSDYAKLEGVFTNSSNYSNYMLRTPSENKSNSTYFVDYDGAIHGDGVVFINNTTNTFNGVRPVVTINIKK